MLQIKFDWIRVPEKTWPYPRQRCRSQVASTCDDLHECVDQGPGENPGVFARALSTVRKLQEAASWDHPVSILMEVEVQLERWFSPEKCGGPDDGLHCRQSLLDHISRLEDAWDRPRA